MKRIAIVVLALAAFGASQGAPARVSLVVIGASVITENASHQV
jgi:hypothetical protein